MVHRWLQAALKQDWSAGKELATLYAKPSPGDPDGAAMLAWFSDAAVRGDSDAQFVLGRCYVLGTCGSPNMEGALDWYTKAADAGHAAAQFHLGALFGDGEGVTQDYDKAAKYYRLSAVQGYGDAVCELAGLYARGACDKPTAERLDLWFHRAAENGHTLAQAHLGLMYSLGDGVERDAAKAKAWYLKASTQGETSAMFNLGILCMDGLGGLERDPKEALRHFVRAARLDSETAGMLRLNGLGMNDEVAQMLNPAMQQMDRSDTLDLSENDIGDTGAIAIAELIESEICPRVIDLRKNPIDSRGAFALESATRRTTALQELKIDSDWNPPYSDLYAERIRIACAVNRNIALLHQWWVDRTQQVTFARMPSEVVQLLESQVVIVDQKRNGDGALTGTWNRLLELDLCFSML